MFEIPNVDIYINTVNCVGVMGKGVALEFKKRFPKMYTAYKRECEKGNVQIGKPHIWREFRLCKALVIINLPTKKHWRNPSKYKYIQSDLIWLRKFLQTQKGLIVALPALGCGNGGLDWNRVKSMIKEHLKGLKSIIYISEPKNFINFHRI